jgi:mannose-6-phosphate isomerase-like protein (cupin superfamily)
MFMLAEKGDAMPIVQGPNATNSTDEFAGWGLAEFKAGQKNVTELHFHDCDEFVFMIEGKMRIRSEGVEYLVVPSDVLATRMGDEHEILEILEDTRYFWLEGALRGQKRHLHRDRDTGK